MYHDRARSTYSMYNGRSKGARKQAEARRVMASKGDERQLASAAIRVASVLHRVAVADLRSSALCEFLREPPSPLLVEHVKKVKKQPGGRTGRQLAFSGWAAGGWAGRVKGSKGCVQAYDGWHHTEISLYTPSSRRAVLPLLSTSTGERTTLAIPSRANWGRRAQERPPWLFGYYSVWTLICCLLCCFPALYIFLDLGFLDKVKLIVTAGLQP